MNKPKFRLGMAMVCVDDVNTDLIFGERYILRLVVQSHKGIAFFVEGITTTCYTPPTFVPSEEYLPFEWDLNTILYELNIEQI